MKKPILILLLALLSTPGAYAQTDTRARLQQLSRAAQFRYNRVEGLFLGYRLGISGQTWPRLKLFVQTGYGFANRDPRWEGGIEYQSPTTSFSFTIFDRTDTFDREIVRTGENTLFSLFFKWDHQDYFRAKHGFEAKGSYRPRRPITILGRLTAFEFVHMPNSTDWSLFYPDRPFRINPRIRPGDVGLLQLGVNLDTNIRSPLFRNAWRAGFLYERGFREFEYNGLILHATRYQKLIFGNQALIIAGRIGSRESTVEQFLFDLGGFSTLRGFGIKEFTGNRMALLNFEYRFRGDVLPHIRIKGFHLLNLIAFLDTGWLNAVPQSTHLLEGFGGLSLKDFKTNIGLGFALPRQLFRFNIARRLDRSNDAWVITARLKHDF